MNIERLHVMASEIKQDLKSTKLLVILQNLVDNLQTQVNAPQDASAQTGVASQLQLLRSGLEASAVNSFPPTWVQALEELDLIPLLGNRLLERVNSVFARNPITPSIALKELQSINSELTRFSQTIDSLVKAFADLGIGREELDAGEAEVGVMVPRTYVSNSLEQFAKELGELDKILKVFAEITTGKRPKFDINSISSSELSIYVAAIPQIAACLAVAIERIVALYKQSLEIRKLKNELEKFEIEKAGLKAIENSVKDKMERGIATLIDDLLEEFYDGNDHARRNELRVELKYTLRKLANRIDRGFNIEVRAELPDEGEAESDKEAEGIEFIERIKQVEKELEFLKVEGKPILRLAERNRRKDDSESDEAERDAADSWTHIFGAMPS